MIEIVEPDCTIRTAMTKLGITDADNVSVRVYRYKSGGGRQSKEFFCTLDYLPEIEDIAEFGGGSYHLQISSGDKTAAANVNIAAKNQQPGQQIQNAIDQYSSLEAALALIQRVQQIAMPQQQPASMPDQLMGSMSRWGEMMIKQQAEHMRQLSEIQRAQYQQQLDYDDDEEIEGEGEMDFDDETLLETVSPLLIEWLPKLLGAGGAAFVPVIKQLPMFLKIKKSVPLIRKIFDRAELSNEERARLAELLSLPADVIRRA